MQTLAAATSLCGKLYTWHTPTASVNRTLMNIIKWLFSGLLCSPTTIVLTTWISTEAPKGVADEVVAGAVAGAVLSVIVVVVFVTAVGVVIWRYTHCCVNTLSISVLELYFTFTTQTKTERNDVIP